MTTTETMRERFEAWHFRPEELIKDKDGNYKDWDTHRLWMAYQQGQRDLIEAMGEPVAYQVISHNGWNDRLYPTKDAPPGLAGFLETERRVGNTVRALYSLPEVGE